MEQLRDGLKVVEDSLDLFWECDFATITWRWLMYIFSASEYPMGGALLWSLWKNRCFVVFDGLDRARSALWEVAINAWSQVFRYMWMDWRRLYLVDWSCLV